jgi:hypothetical protein
MCFTPEVGDNYPAAHHAATFSPMMALRREGFHLDRYGILMISFYHLLSAHLILVCNFCYTINFVG